MLGGLGSGLRILQDVPQVSGGQRRFPWCRPRCAARASRCRAIGSLEPCAEHQARQTIADAAPHYQGTMGPRPGHVGDPPDQAM